MPVTYPAVRDVAAVFAVMELAVFFELPSLFPGIEGLSASAGRLLEPKEVLGWKVGPHMEDVLGRLSGMPPLLRFSHFDAAGASRLALTIDQGEVDHWARHREPNRGDADLLAVPDRAVADQVVELAVAMNRRVRGWLHYERPLDLGDDHGGLPSELSEALNRLGREFRVEGSWSDYQNIGVVACSWRGHGRR